MNVNKAAAFPVTGYTAKEISSAFNDIKSHWSDASIRVAVWNIGVGIWKPFLDVTEDDLQQITEGNVHGPFAFSKEVISVFRKLECVPVMIGCAASLSRGMAGRDG